MERELSCLLVTSGLTWWPFLNLRGGKQFTRVLLWWNNSLWGQRGAGSHGRSGIHLVGRGGSRMISQIQGHRPSLELGRSGQLWCCAERSVCEYSCADVGTSGIGKEDSQSLFVSRREEDCCPHPACL